MSEPQIEPDLNDSNDLRLHLLISAVQTIILNHFNLVQSAVQTFCLTFINKIRKIGLTDSGLILIITL